MVIIFFYSFWKTRVLVLHDLESVLHRIEEGVKDKAMARTRERDFLLTRSNDGFSHTEQFSNHHSFLDQMSYRENCMLDWTCLHHHFSNYCFFYIILKKKIQELFQCFWPSTWSRWNLLGFTSYTYLILINFHSIQNNSG